jgi:SAM-dependent methyltransferase
MALTSLRATVKGLKSLTERIFYSYPKNVECNLCGWQGRQFVSDSWHDGINCPRCQSSIRHRLFVGALQGLAGSSIADLVRGKKILHFAPERALGVILQQYARQYLTADCSRGDCDLSLDLCDMSSIKKGTFDTVIAFDVLEHVTDYRRALAEIKRVLTPGGYGILTVPQQDHLAETFEDLSITTAAERAKHFGQWDHLRVFGDDFPELVRQQGFKVDVIDESKFPPGAIRRNVLFPPALSARPLATNHRKIYLSQKN